LIEHDDANGCPAPRDAGIDRRFGGVARLYGEAALARFARAHVCVVGIGGVGSWSAEALARSGIGTLTLIDLDHVAESNVNRQIHALEEAFGAPKVSVMARRIRGIHPRCVVIEIEQFVGPQNVQVLVGAELDFVIDAADSVAGKVALVAHCRERGIPIVTVGAAGGRMDPTRVQVRDLARTEHEPLLARVRRRLRDHHGFPRGPKRKFGIEAVCSDEPVRPPSRSESAASSGAQPPITGLACAGYGSSVCVTATFGLVAASRALQRLASASTLNTSESSR
jgi:tRNA A37 threonylcarbamoyladenosine dehydratase